jgi:hypothetical protein
MSEQNEEFATGQRSIEQAQGYLPPLPDTSKAEAQAVEDKAVNDYVERTNELNRATAAEEDMPLDLGYNRLDGEGRVDKRVPVSKEKAAADLSRYREGLAETHQALRDQQLKEQLEQARSPLAKEIVEGKAETEQAFDRGYEAAQAAAERAQQAQQPEQPVQQPVDQDLSRILQENPRLMEAINQQRAIDMHQGQQAVAYAEQWVQDNAKQALAGVFVRHPELAALSDWRQLPVAMEILSKSNPQKAQEIVQEISGIQSLLQQSAQVQQQQQQRAAQQYQYQWDRFKADEDAKFISRNPQMADPAAASAITNKAINYLRGIGFSDQDLGAVWEGRASLSARDHRMQQLILDAMSFREARAAVPNARVNKPVRVQQPGAGGQIASQGDVDLRSLSQNLAKNPTGTASIRAAAELLAARRQKGWR